MKVNDGQCEWDDADDSCIPEAFEKGRIQVRSVTVPVGRRLKFTESTSTKVDQEVSSRARQTLETSTGRTTGPPEKSRSPKGHGRWKFVAPEGGIILTNDWMYLMYLRPLVLTSPGEGMTLTGGRVENDRGVLEGFALLGDICNLHPRESEHTFYS